MGGDKTSKSKEAPACTEKITVHKTSNTTSLLTLSIAVVALAVGCLQWVDVPFPTGGVHNVLLHQLSVVRETLGLADAKTEELPPKYESDMVALQVRHLVSDLKCNDSDYHATPLFEGKVFHVTEPMEATEPLSDSIFFMLNGANEGVYVSWNGQFDCVGQAAARAAAWLGADQDVMMNGVRLYNQMGYPVRTAKDLSDTKHIVHVLLDFQLWQWPGIKKGYKYVLEDGVTLTTIGMSPKVFDVEYFFTQEEADRIIEIGSPLLNRSMVDGKNTSRILSDSRTSHTAFLPDSWFVRDFRKRATRVARLPSPSYGETLQLVRYAAGEFYRQHFDTFHSREFVPNGANSYKYEDYVQWANRTAEKLRGMDQSKVPEKFREGGPLFPNADDPIVFPNALLELFVQHMNTTNRFKALYESDYQEWIRTNLDRGAQDILKVLLKEGERPQFLPLIIDSWEDALKLGELHYSFPKPAVNSASHFFHWIRWAKERVSYLGDKVPTQARPSGALYPQFTIAFQEMLLGFVLDDYTEGFVSRITNKEWYDWMVTNRGRTNVLIQVLKAWPQFAELVIRTWEARVGSVPELRYTLPKYVPHFNPQRYVTLFLYLNNQTKVGGETVFPFSLDRYSDEEIVRDGMNECSTGLAVPPRALHASLFYVQTPEGIPDYMSRHGGCPPLEGVKWGANSFMWDADSEEGANIWNTK